MRKIFNSLLAVLLVIAPLLLSSAPPVAAQSIGADKITRAVFRSAARGTTTSDTFNVEHRTGFVAFLNVTANAGSSPTLDVKFQDSPTGAAPWFDLVSFTQMTGSTSS